MPIPGEALVTLHRGLHPGLFITVLVLAGVAVVGLLLAAGFMMRILKHFAFGGHDEG